MHHALVYARLARHCSNTEASGNQTECDRGLLDDLVTCRDSPNQYCFFEMIAEEELCATTDADGTQAMCMAMDRITSFMLYARQAFCDEPDAKSGCSFWQSLRCTASILAASASCLATGVVGMFPCIVGVLGRQSSCVTCLCRVIHLCD